MNKPKESLVGYEGKKFITMRAVCRQLSLDSNVLDRLEELQIVIPVRRPGRERAYVVDDFDRLRVYSVLVNELEVNGAGAEIILQLRTRLMDARSKISKLLHHAQSQGFLDNLKEILNTLDE